MPKELNIIQHQGSGGDACTYMWACAICDENETCQKDKEGHSRWLVAKRCCAALNISAETMAGTGTVIHWSRDVG